jgi:hypothetical protein
MVPAKTGWGIFLFLYGVSFGIVLRKPSIIMLAHPQNTKSADNSLNARATLLDIITINFQQLISSNKRQVSLGGSWRDMSFSVQLQSGN